MLCELRTCFTKRNEWFFNNVRKIQKSLLVDYQSISLWLFFFYYLKSTNQKKIVYENLHCFDTPLFTWWERLRLHFVVKFGFCHVLQQNVLFKIAKFVAKYNNSRDKKKFLFLRAYIFSTADVVNMDSCCIIDDKSQRVYCLNL